MPNRLARSAGLCSASPAWLAADVAAYGFVLAFGNVVVWTVGRRVEEELEMFGDASSGAGLLWLWPRWTFVVVYVVPVLVVEVVVGLRGMMCRN